MEREAKPKSKIWKKILSIVLIIIGMIAFLLGGAFLKASLFGSNYTGRDLDKHITFEDEIQEIQPLKAVGKGLYNKNGDLVTLNGVNFGNWLIQEGWLSSTSLGPLLKEDGSYKEVNEDGIVTGYEEMYQEEIIEAINNNPNLTAEQIEVLWDVYYKSYIQEEDFKNVKDLGLNTIRLPMYYRNFLKGDDDNLVMRDDAFTLLDWFLEMCKKYELYAVLDMHGVVGGNNGYEHSGSRKYDFWTNKTYQETICNLWKNIASHYMNDRKDLIETIATFDIINEPCGESKTTEKEQWIVMDKIYKAIREVDDLHVITFEGCWYFSSFPNPEDYKWENVMYEVHLYNWSPTISNELFFKFHDLLFSFADYDVPYYIGEFNFFDDEEQWLKWLNEFDMRNYSWTIWNYKMASVGNWDNSWGLYVYKMNLKKDELKLDLRTATFEEIYEEWSTQGTSQKYTSTGLMKKVIEEHYIQKKLNEDKKQHENEEIIESSIN